MKAMRTLRLWLSTPFVGKMLLVVGLVLVALGYQRVASPAEGAPGDVDAVYQQIMEGLLWMVIGGAACALGLWRR